MRSPLALFRAATAALFTLVLFASSLSAATITIINADAAGEGFNDPTPAVPVGGNPGTTVGEQRLFVFRFAANVWGNILPSNVEILVNSAFNPLTCNATSGVLGSAGPTSAFRNFIGAPLTNHWYHQALANRLFGQDNDPTTNDINATFNSSIGTATCLPMGWYYGVDGSAGTQLDLLAVLLHEFGHGLGFSTTTNAGSGAFLQTLPSAYDHFLLDNTNGLHWDVMNAAQRVASAVACNHLVWDGASVVAHVPALLTNKPVLRVTAPASIAGDYDVGSATFGTPLSSTPVTARIVLADDAFANPTNGCEPLVNGAAVAGNIALMDRGTCAFTVKAQNAQAAGAIALVVADSVPGCPPADVGGVDPTITIPVVRITQADGNTIKANLAGGVSATLIQDPALRAGADAAGRLKVYTPSAFASGSTVSHWDVTATPNLLMEPFINPLPAGEVDMTRWHFTDIGWFTGPLAVGDGPTPRTRLIGNAPNPFFGATTISFVLERDLPVELSVYDLSGRLVSSLAHQVLPSGPHAVKWDGRSLDGRRAPPGVYMYRRAAGSMRDDGRMVLWR
jgi:hypothetical protein